MLSICLGLALQAATPLLPGGGVEIPNEIQPAVLDYTRCLSDSLGTERMLSGNYQADLQRINEAIADCGDERAAALRQSDLILSSAEGYADASRRSEVLRQVFDGVEQQERYILEMTYQQLGLQR